MSSAYARMVVSKMDAPHKYRSMWGYDLWRSLHMFISGRIEDDLQPGIKLYHRVEGYIVERNGGGATIKYNVDGVEVIYDLGLDGLNFILLTERNENPCS